VLLSEAGLRYRVDDVFLAMSKKMREVVSPSALLVLLPGASAACAQPNLIAQARAIDGPCSRTARFGIRRFVQIGDST
jgi:hypothetical protein